MFLQIVLGLCLLNESSKHQLLIILIVVTIRDFYCIQKNNDKKTLTRQKISTKTKFKLIDEWMYMISLWQNYGLLLYNVLKNQLQLLSFKTKKKVKMWSRISIQISRALILKSLRDATNLWIRISIQISWTLMLKSL